MLLLTVACDAVFGALSVFAPSFTILLALRFLTGVAVGGTLPVDALYDDGGIPAVEKPWPLAGGARGSGRSEH